MRNLITALISFIFPPECIGCGESREYLCDTCLRQLQKYSEPFYSDGIITALFPYKNKMIRKAIWFLKYKRITEIANIFGGLFYDYIQEDENFKRENTIILIPIPVVGKSLRKRGFNQSVLLAHALAKKDPKKILVYENVLMRKHGSHKQTESKNRAERLKNMRGAFVVTNTEKINNQTVVVIDDVITTGATIQEATKTLLQNTNAKSVYGVAISKAG